MSIASPALQGFIIQHSTAMSNSYRYICSSATSSKIHSDSTSDWYVVCMSSATLAISIFSPTSPLDKTHHGVAEEFLLKKRFRARCTVVLWVVVVIELEKFRMPGFGMLTYTSLWISIYININYKQHIHIFRFLNLLPRNIKNIFKTKFLPINSLKKSGKQNMVWRDQQKDFNRALHCRIGVMFPRFPKAQMKKGPMFSWKFS